MMYSEFVAGTGCKDNAHNYKVFQNLEAMYMNTDMSKTEIYEYGKKLVDNSKSEEELKVEAEIKAEIEHHKRQIEIYKSDINWKKNLIEADPEDKEWVKDCKHMIKYYREQIQFHKNKIAALKWVLGK